MHYYVVTYRSDSIAVSSFWEKLDQNLDNRFLIKLFPKKFVAVIALDLTRGEFSEKEKD